MTERRRWVGSAMQWSALAACALVGGLAGAGCTDTYGMVPESSTETGNPPVIDTGAISLVVSEDAVHVVGDPGAVMPPEGTVEITVVKTGKKITGMVNPDGSFDVQVDGTLDDVFEVRVVNDGQSSMVVTVKRGGATVGGPDGGVKMNPNPIMPMGQDPPPPVDRPAACKELDERVTNGAAMVAAGADRSCMTDRDCTVVLSLSRCDQSCGAVNYVSHSGAMQIAGGESQIKTIVCGDYEQLDCQQMTGCDLGWRPPVCVANTCQPEGTGNPCDDCGDLEISWRATGPGTLPAEIDPSVHTIRGCGKLSTTTFDMQTCSSELPACGVPGSDWKQKLDMLLANDDVVKAIDAGGTHGEPDQYSGIQWEITVGGSTFRFNECAGLNSRMCAYSGISDLLALLNALNTEFRCGSSSGDDCTSPYDPGTTDANVRVYWHDPASRTCFPRLSGATGGNGNRYMTLEDCQRACPPPGAMDCAMDREFVDNRCLQCGFTGGCLETSPSCVKTCASDADCKGEEGGDPVAIVCDDGLCNHKLICF